jgi:hypothetical protein
MQFLSGGGESAVSPASVVKARFRAVKTKKAKA